MLSVEVAGRHSPSLKNQWPVSIDHYGIVLYIDIFYIIRTIVIKNVSDFILILQIHELNGRLTPSGWDCE